MNEVSLSATINDYLLELGPDSTLVLRELSPNDQGNLTLTPSQTAALFAFFQRPDVVNRLEGPPAD